ACVFRSYHGVLAFKALRAGRAPVLERVALRASLECCAAPWSGASPSRQSRLRAIKEKSYVVQDIHSEQQAAPGRLYARHREGDRRSRARRPDVAQTLERRVCR